MSIKIQRALCNLQNILLTFIATQIFWTTYIACLQALAVKMVFDYCNGKVLTFFMYTFHTIAKGIMQATCKLLFFTCRFFFCHLLKFT